MLNTHVKDILDFYTLGIIYIQKVTHRHTFHHLNPKSIIQSIFVPLMSMLKTYNMNINHGITLYPLVESTRLILPMMGTLYEFLKQI